MKKKYVKARHRFWYWFLRPVGKVIARKYKFKYKPYKMGKNEQFLILSNHQSFLEPALLAINFSKPVYFVASDSLRSQKLWSRLLFHCLAPIPITKGARDIKCIRTMCHIAKEGGSIALYPEGNRQWCDFQFHIDKAIVKLIRLVKLPIVLYNFHGGYGVDPRWSSAKRSGNYVGQIKRIIFTQEIAHMTDDQLYQTVVQGLKVIDPESGESYKSEKRAEYLERLFFVCPKCHAQSTLCSQGNHITCSACGMSAEYGEDMHLHSDDPDFLFCKAVQWYEFQLQHVKNCHIQQGVTILQDEKVTLFDKTNLKRKKLASGKITLDSNNLTIGNFIIPTSEIDGASAQDGTKFVFNANGASYMVVGDERFNGVKYCLFFNRVCKQIADVGGDKYYGLHLNPEQK